MLKPFCLYQSYKVGLVTEFIDSFLGELIFYTSRVNLYSRSSILKKTFIQSCPCTSKSLKQCLFVFENNRDASYFFPNWFSVEQINSIFFLSPPAGSYLQPRKLIYCSQRLCSSLFASLGFKSSSCLFGSTSTALDFYFYIHHSTIQPPLFISNNMSLFFIITTLSVMLVC